MNITFYEKPRCINNGKQKKVLQNAGHTLTSIDILTYPWSRETLLAFVSGKTPTEMMNHTAPVIKNGELDPKTLDFDEALEMMITNPLLIKRPLITVDNLNIQGFTDQRLRPYLGSWDDSEDITTCPNVKTISCDEQAVAAQKGE